MADKRPAFQFYPGDWMKDPAVRSCSLAARGLWFDMICLMLESPRRGYLEHASGQPVTCDQLARMTGAEAGQVDLLLAELEDAAVFSRTPQGVIFSRRIIRDEKLRRIRAECGKLGAPHGHKGGRPKQQNNPSTNRKLTRPATAKKPLAAGQNNPPSSSSSTSPSGEEKNPDACASGADVPSANSTPSAPLAKPRQRNPLFDAVATVTATDPITAGSLVGAVAAALARADPPYSVADVHEFARRFWEFCPWAAADARDRPTPKELQTHIGKLRAAPAPPQTKHSRQAGSLMDFAGLQEARIIAQAEAARRAP